MSEDQPKTVLTYAQGNFERPTRTWTMLIVFDVLAGIILLLCNGAGLHNRIQDLRDPPALRADDTEDAPTSIAPWQDWTVIVDAALSIGLVSLLFTAAAVSRPGRNARRAIKFHVLYVVAKISLVVVVEALDTWNVDKQRLDWGWFGIDVVMGVFHPLLIAAMAAHLRKQIRRRNAKTTW